MDEVIDAKKHNQVDRFQIPEVGIVLEPGRTYLGSTVEYTETRRSCLSSKGSRVSAGWALTSMRRRERGVGFCNHWTLEISVSQPVRVYAGMPIGQLIYFLVEGDVALIMQARLRPNITSVHPSPSSP